MIRIVGGFAALIAVALIAPGRAAAGQDIAAGAVVKIEAEEVYVSLGTEHGVRDGDPLRLKRPITLRHPVTRAAVADWIPIGSAVVTQAGARMSRAVVGDLITELKLGDVAEVLIGRPDPPRAPPPGEPAPAIDAATAEILAVFSAQVGQPLEPRIAAWERYLSSHPGAPFAPAIRHDVDVLRALRDQLRPRATAQAAEPIGAVASATPTTAREATDLPVVVVVDDPDRVASAYLHYRARGSRTYRSVLLVREHDLYLRGAIPAAAVHPPGVDYFVEVSSPSGQAGLAVGTPAAPITVEVAPPTILDRFAASPGRSSVRLAVDYLDFATFDKRAGDHRDHQLTGSVDFTYRLDSVVESLGVGYGVYAGAGGSASQDWTALALPRTGFQYGYADLELGGRIEELHLAAGGQLIAGVGKRGFGLGVEGRVRIGDRDATNLVVLGRTVDQVGFLSAIRLGTAPLARVRIGVSVGATNQPGETDVGVKLGTDVELAVAPHVALVLDGSWQGRSVDHGGIGGGGGLGFSW